MGSSIADNMKKKVKRDATVAIQIRPTRNPTCARKRVVSC